MVVKVMVVHHPPPRRPGRRRPPRLHPDVHARLPQDVVTAVRPAPSSRRGLTRPPRPLRPLGDVGFALRVGKLRQRQRRRRRRYGRVHSLHSRRRVQTRHSSAAAAVPLLCGVALAVHGACNRAASPARLAERHAPAAPDTEKHTPTPVTHNENHAGASPALYDFSTQRRVCTNSPKSG